MVGQIEPSIIVRTILEINENKFVIGWLEFWTNQNIPLLQVCNLWVILLSDYRPGP